MNSVVVFEICFHFYSNCVQRAIMNVSCVRCTSPAGVHYKMYNMLNHHLMRSLMMFASGAIGNFSQL